MRIEIGWPHGIRPAKERKRIVSCGGNNAYASPGEMTLNRLQLAMAALSLLFFVSSSLGSAMAQKEEVLNRTSPDAFIIMQRGACEMGCSAYRIIIFDDGTLIWDGQAGVRKLGLASGTVDTIALKRFFDEIQAIDYFNLKNEYMRPDPGCAPAVTDEPVVILTVSAAGKAKTIIHHHSCRGLIPDKLAAMEDKIDKLARSARWK